MGALIVVLFIGLPILEIWVLIQVGEQIGLSWTLLLLIGDAVLGSWLVRREGRRAWRALSRAISDVPSSGRVPAREVLDGALVLVGGTLLLAPGFVTDVFGLLCVLPVTRPLVRRVVLGRLSRRARMVTRITARPPRVIDPE